MSGTTKDEAQIPANAILIEHRVVDGESQYTYYIEGDEKADNEAKVAKDIIDNLLKGKIKDEKKKSITGIRITSSSNNEFNCDEVSQQRMARKIIVMDDTEKVDWKLSDNTIVKVKKEELIEALKLAMIEQELIQLEE